MSDAPDATWHPAFMPNSVAHLPSHSQPVDLLPTLSDDEPRAETDAPLVDAPPAPTDTARNEPEAWFPDYGTATAPLRATDATNALKGPPAGPDNVVKQVHPAPAKVSKHASSTSFARTVSHDISFGDDEEPDWDLPRPASDSFEMFISSDDRTSSFPTVAPASHTEGHLELDQPLPSNQAEDVIREMEQEDHKLAHGSAEAAFTTDEDGFLDDDCNEHLGGAAQAQVAGGDLHGTSEEAAEARFAEGIPLLSHSAASEGLEATASAAEKDLFTDDTGGGEDDFFNKARDDEQSLSPPSLEPKSTEQVTHVDGRHPSTVPVSNTLGEAAKGDFWDQPRDAPPPEPVSEPPPRNSAGVQTSDEPAAEGRTEDLDAKWKAMFGEEEEGLLQDDALLEEDAGNPAFDPAAFVGSDDEGFLDDDPAELLATQASTQPTLPAVPAPYGATGPYMAPAQASAPANLYLPPQPIVPVSNPQFPVPPVAAVQFPRPSLFPARVSAPTLSSSPNYAALPPRPEPSRSAQSFADKSKGGYSSPYDLPMDIVKPRKRVSTQTLQQRNVLDPGGPMAGQGPPPPRSASAFSPPSQTPVTTNPSPPRSSHASYPPAFAQQPPRQPAKKDSFFQELPVSSRPRPGSRNSTRGLPSPSQANLYYAPQPEQQVLHPPSAIQQQPAASPGNAPAPYTSRLVAPPQLNPYAEMASATPPSLPAAKDRYTPSPASLPQANGQIPSANNRHLPPPAAARTPNPTYAPAVSGSTPPVHHAHQPRTSSPLAQFEITNDRTRLHPSTQTEPAVLDRRSASSLHDGRFQRMPSLPQVEEEEGSSQTQRFPGHSVASQLAASPDLKAGHFPPQTRHTPPPISLPGQTTLSPTKRSTTNYSPVAQGVAPPARSQTQSPSALYGNNRAGRSSDPIPRPSSVSHSTSPRVPLSPETLPTNLYPPIANASSPVITRPRRPSLSLNLVQPTDGREHDVLKRWQGSPLISWGVNGTIVTMFPKDVPRYGMNAGTPNLAMIIRNPGPVTVKHIKDIQPLDERLAKFPGPLKGKSKKKEIIAWLSAGIESLEKASLAHSESQPYEIHEDKRAVDRVLLWKILHVFIENDGSLEGMPAAEKAVREILLPHLDASAPDTGYRLGEDHAGLPNPSAPATQADAVDAAAMEQIRIHLLRGNREKAAWTAVDKRLWGHAMLISSSSSAELHKQVVREYVKKEVNFPGHNNESLAAFYEVLSGNHEESMDELVPVHARVGLQLVAKDPTSGPSKDGLEGLDKWRETLGFILSNRSSEDGRAINSLGNLLSGYGRAEAAHICFMFSRHHTIFGGLDDPQANFVLVGSDHKRQVAQLAKDIEPVLLSEVYEYGLSLGGASLTTAAGCPHLAGYKMQHALILAEHGFRDKALQYCEVIAAAITPQTKRSPYYHHILEAEVDDLAKRLRQASNGVSGSWISKAPTMNKVSDTVWNKFTSFVSGDDSESVPSSTAGEGAESGPFARVPSGAHSISRPNSSSANLEMLAGAPVPSYGVPMMGPPVGPSAVPATRAAAKYAPAGAAVAAASSGGQYEPSTYTPRSSTERTSGEFHRDSFEQHRQSSDFQQHQPGNAANGYALIASSPARSLPSSQPASMPNLSRESSYMPATQPDAQAPPARSSFPANRYEPTTPVTSASPLRIITSPPVNHGPARISPEKPPPSSNKNGYQPMKPYENGPQPYTPYDASAATPPGAGFQEPSEPAAKPGEANGYGGGSYEPPSYGYEPPSYNPEPDLADGGSGSEEDESSKPKPKKRGIIYDDGGDDFMRMPEPTESPAKAGGEKSRAEKDRENKDLVRRIAEQEAKQAAEAKQSKKGWGFSSWFSKRDSSSGGSDAAAAGSAPSSSGTPGKPIKANLGEANSFYYDTGLKRWVSKNATAGEKAAMAKSTATPPPPRSAAATPDIPGGGGGGGGQLPSLMQLRSVSGASVASSGGGGPPSRPATAASASSSIDDLLAGGGRKAGAKKPKRGARYVDVMQK